MSTFSTPEAPAEAEMTPQAAAWAAAEAEVAPEAPEAAAEAEMAPKVTLETA